MNFIETDERAIRLNELHRLDKEDAEIMKTRNKSKKTTRFLGGLWGGK